MKLIIAGLTLILSSIAFINCSDTDNSVSKNISAIENFSIQISNIPFSAKDYSVTIIAAKTETGEIFNFKVETEVSDSMNITMNVNQRPYDIFAILSNTPVEVETGEIIDDILLEVELTSYIYNYTDSRILDHYMFASTWQFVADYLGVEIPSTKAGNLQVVVMNDEIEVSWNEVEQVDSYELYYAKGGFVTTLDTKIEINTNQISLDIDDFDSDEMYTFAVISVLNDQSKSDISEPFSIIISAE